MVSIYSEGPGEEWNLRILEDANILRASAIYVNEDSTMKIQSAIALAVLMSVSVATHASGWGVEDMNAAYGSGEPSSGVSPPGPIVSSTDSEDADGSLEAMYAGYGGRQAVEQRTALDSEDAAVSRWSLSELYSAFGG